MGLPRPDIFGEMTVVAVDHGSYDVVMVSPQALAILEQYPELLFPHYDGFDFSEVAASLNISELLASVQVVSDAEQHKPVVLTYRLAHNAPDFFNLFREVRGCFHRERR
jgi:hypothetical protein